MKQLINELYNKMGIVRFLLFPIIIILAILDELKDHFIAFFIFSIMIFGSLFFMYIYEKTTCHITAKKLNYKCEYDIFAGCIIEKENGKKVLLRQMREMD